MGFTRGMKRPIEILYKRLSSPVNCGHVYSTSAVHKDVSFARFSENNAAGSSNYSSPMNGFGICLTRNYSSEASSSEQMNLIKQLRERTSAPIKEVKSALVSCNWDIGESMNFPFSFSIFGFEIVCIFECFYNNLEVIFDYCRGCTEGFEKKRSCSCIEEIFSNCCWGFACVGSEWKEGCCCWTQLWNGLCC